MNEGYTPLSMDARIMCPSCRKVHMQMWTLPFDAVWHCDGCGNTIVACKQTIDWTKLIGTTTRCKFGIGNPTHDKHGEVLNCDVISVRGNEVEIRLEHNTSTTWYTIYDGYVKDGWDFGIVREV